MEQSEKAETQWRCYIHAVGIKKRCRKVDRHQFPLGYFDIDTPSNVIAEKAKLEVIKQMKTLEKTPCVNFCYVTINGNMETWEPFSGRDKKIELEVNL